MPRKPVWSGGVGDYKVERTAYVTAQLFVGACLDHDGTLRLEYSWSDDPEVRSVELDPKKALTRGITFGYENKKVSGANNLGTKVAAEIVADTLSAIANGLLVERTGG